MWQSILDRALSRNRFTAGVARRIRRVANAYCDPVVRYSLKGKELALPLSHELPFHLRDIPTYSANLNRIAAFVRRTFGNLVMIDVGANVGDSFCLAGGESDDQYLLIEGDARYFELLRRNVGQSATVTCVRAFLSDRAGPTNDMLVALGGTAKVQTSGTGANGIRYSTLDEVVATNPAFKSSNLVKTDVDGFDCKVLTGGAELIKEACPVIFFEHDPGLLLQADQDPLSFFSTLSAWGYRRFILYDNRGFLVTVVDADNISLIEDLMFYSRQQQGYYYDICAFHSSHAHFQNLFLADERRFYTQLSMIHLPAHG